MDTPLLQRFMHQLLSQFPVCCHYHVRDQKEGIFDSIEEVMVWHHGTQARYHICHLKFGGASHLGRFDACYQQLLAWRDQADFALSWDTYPFAFASSTITSFFPTTDFWQEHSEVEFCQWIADNPPHKLADVVIICDDPLFNQRTLSAISKTLNESLAKTLLTICQRLNGAGTYQRQFCETADLNWLLAQPDVLIASDSFGLDQVHPRNHSTFTQVLYQAWCQGEAAFHEMVQRIQHGANLVFPDIPMPSLAIGEPAELFFFTPIKQEIPTDTSTAFAISGTLIGYCLLSNTWHA
ncbi:hypothetical protein [Photobacterium nomapromontoriensis]|uniref:hypothetical protein n=1 Tax=Photobacterium nomapromontoriensis TaxID=2910237 RepID=UPI003D1361E7